MQPTSIFLAGAAGFIAGIAVTTIIARIFWRQAVQKLSQAYDRIIDKADARTDKADQRLAELMDRWYGEKNLPPGNVDMAEVYKERRAEEKEKRIERRNGGPLVPRRIGMVDQVQADMEKLVKDREYPRSTGTDNK